MGTADRDAGDMGVDTLNILSRALQTWAFCLAISALMYALVPDRPYGVALAYSLCIGTACWAIADFGRLLLRRPDDRGGWHQDWRGAVLAAASLGGGFMLGTAVADACLGESSWTGHGYIRRALPVTVAAGVSLMYFFHSRGRGADLEAQAREAARSAAQARLKLLEAQLEPHMLFNTLANLRVLVGSDAVRAQGMLDHLIAYLRAMLGASRATLHPLADEFARLADYLALMQVRMGPRLSYGFELPTALADVPVPPLLLQPLVENSIRHGLEPQVAGGRIDIMARAQGSGATAQLVLEVRDNGVNGAADDGATPAIGSGFGLAQVRERLATAYGPAATMALSRGEVGGTRVTLGFPLPTSTPARS